VRTITWRRRRSASIRPTSARYDTRGRRSAALGPATSVSSLTCPVRPRSADGQRERRGGRPWAGRTSRGSAPSAERLDQSLDSSLACVHSLGGLDVVDVLASESEGEPVEGGTGCRGCVEGDLRLAGSSTSRGLVSSSSVSRPGLLRSCRCGAVGPADGDEVPPVRGDAAAPGEAVYGDRDCGPLPVIECVDDLGGHLGARCVPGGTTWRRRPGRASPRPRCRRTATTVARGARRRRSWCIEPR
jgi:hypothetical protein